MKKTELIAALKPIEWTENLPSDQRPVFEDKMYGYVSNVYINCSIDMCQPSGVSLCRKTDEKGFGEGESLKFNTLEEAKAQCWQWHVEHMLSFFNYDE